MNAIWKLFLIYEVQNKIKITLLKWKGIKTLKKWEHILPPYTNILSLSKFIPDPT